MFRYRYTIFAVVFVFISFIPSSFGQIIDDFSDGNFSASPTWVGNTSNFKINLAGALQLNAPDAGISMLAVQGNIPDSALYSFDVKMEFAASTSNKLRIWLQADQSNLISPKGYFLEIGENGNLDAVRFYRSDGATEVLLATGVAGAVGADPIDINIQITRSNTGVWNLSMQSGSGQFVPQFSTTDHTYPGNGNLYFGFLCTYSSTRKDKFYFDNISILPDLPDSAPPTLLNASAIDAMEVMVTFNEPVDAVSAEKASNYMLSGGIGAAVSATLLPDNQSVSLIFAAQMQNTVAYTLTCQQIADLVGNVSGSQSTSFTYLKISDPLNNDILINEIMADPTPAVGLPEAEWIELYNRTDKYFDLADLRIKDLGGTPIKLPSKIFPPKSYLVLCSSSFESLLQPVTSLLVPVGNFPALNNDGDLLVLDTEAGTVIDIVNYALDWHVSFIKMEGGWSLERKNVLIPCSGKSNWQSATNAPGGTPGLQNFGFDESADNTPPKVSKVVVVNSTELLVKFNETMAADAVDYLDDFNITPSIDIVDAAFLSFANSEIKLTLANPLNPSVFYFITFGSDIKDCSGNAINSNTPIQIALPDKPEPNDIVINEILFNPVSFGARYVEFYNNSAKVFSWRDFSIADFSGGADVRPILSEDLFLPNTYVVFTSDTSNINNLFFVENPNHLKQTSLPSFDDSEGNISLIWSSGTDSVTVDSFDYSVDLHNALLPSGEREGTALERLRIDLGSNQASNWTSAARQNVGAAGTPTRTNSQSAPPIPSNTDDLLTLQTNKISPNGDGFQDFLEIAYQLPSEGYAATLTIYDSDGVPIKKLVKQVLIGTNGIIRWDGDTDNGDKARPGIHILYFEIYHPDGHVKKSKKTIAVVGLERD